tara:strand:- start:18063 stop:18227 length:165 start_codon:yes stop_codon:yes gene_type:complete
MNNIRWIVLGYFMAICINGCDLGITNNNEGGFDEITNSGIGSSQWNPVYVKVVD